MRILIYGLNYSPELTGVGKYTGEMAAWLAAQGHEVRVVTAPPYYPEWRIQQRYSGWQYRVETADGKGGPTVYRCPLWVPSRPTGMTRLLHLSSFAVSSLPVMTMQALWKPELVFTVEPTFFAAPMALLTALVTGAASWLHVQDLEVDAAFNLKLLPADGFLHGIALRMESFFTGCFSRVSSISDKMVRRVATKTDLRSEVVLFPNWGDVEHVRPVARDATNSYRQELGLAGKVVFLYSGNMGEKQGLDVLSPLIEWFQEDEQVHFLLCGDGVYRHRLEKLMRHRANVTMLPLQPADRLSELLVAADVHLLPQKRDASDLAMPSKLNGIFASGRPVIAVANEGTQIAEVVSGRGLVVPTGDMDALCAASLRLAKDPDLRASLGMAAREYAVKYVDKERVLRRFESAITELMTPVGKTEEVRLARSYRA